MTWPKGMARTDNKRAATAYSIDPHSAARAELDRAEAGISERPVAASVKEPRRRRASAASGCGSATTARRATRSRAINDSEGSATEAAACRDRRDGAGAAPLSPIRQPRRRLAAEAATARYAWRNRAEGFSVVKRVPSADCLAGAFLNRRAGYPSKLPPRPAERHLGLSATCGTPGTFRISKLQ